jgi:hypothetical protein
VWCRYAREEIPLHIVPMPRISESCIDNWHELVDILMKEESEAYARVKVAENNDIVVQVHNGSGELSLFVSCVRKMLLLLLTLDC